MDNLVEQFTSLFEGNRSAVGTEHGGCQRLLEGRWAHALRTHLTSGGQDTIGVYPLVYTNPVTGVPNRDGYGWEVHWGCVDFDEGEEASWAHARNLVKILSKFSVTGWIERSRSKGFHVWVFEVAGKWVPAATVRRGLLVACDLVDAPTREINPKAEGYDDPSTLGNYVRLPYPGWLGENFSVDKRVMVVGADADTLLLEDFLKGAHAHAGLDGLQTLASHWQPPTRAVELPDGDYEIPEDLEPAIARIRPWTRRIWEDGPLPNSDRSGTLFRLAAKLYEDGQHTFPEIVGLVTAADHQWGKFWTRHDSEKRIVEIVEKVWQ